MAETMSRFAAFSLELLSPLHLGSRRAGVVAQTHRHAPGHLFVHALAAAVGAARDGLPEHFAEALAEVMRRFRFGPAFFIDGERRLDDTEVERRLLSSSHHVTLDGATRSAVESALFEVEQLAVPAGGSIRLRGGVWFDDERLDAHVLREWLSNIRLGGEIKTGCGHVHCDGWQADAPGYPGNCCPARRSTESAACRCSPGWVVGTIRSSVSAGACRRRCWCACMAAASAMPVSCPAVAAQAWAAGKQRPERQPGRQASVTLALSIGFARRGT
jgi:hypothetical protein